MKIKVITEAIIDTDKISPLNKNVKVLIEKAAFNKETHSVAMFWAIDEVDFQQASKKITLELL